MKQIQILTFLTFFCASANLVIAQTEKSGGDGRHSVCAVPRPEVAGQCLLDFQNRGLEARGAR